MDMELSEQQRHFVDTARHFLEKECALSAVREQETSETGFSLDLWRQMAELGWLGLPFPEQYGGYGLGNVDLALLSKEMGRALCPSPYIPSVVLAGGAILAAGSEEQKQAWLPRIASGQTVIAFALQEASPYWDPRGIGLRVSETADGWALNGTKMFVEFAGAADRMLVMARTSDEKPSKDGITMLLVDPRAPGITMRPLGTLARDRQFRVDFAGAPVSKSDVLGPVGGAWPLLERVVQSGIVAFSAYNVGASERIHAMATEFAKNRVQFGRPIGSFQAIQHYLAQSITEIIGADTMTLYAAWCLDEGEPAREIVAKAKALAGDTYKSTSALGAQIYGGIGFNEDVDTTLFLRRGKQAQLSMGDTGYWEDVIAEELLGEA
jgi:alkylation response protein AidB-like acyl-CoA dehydrogenase